jgi:hypothetical protein
MNSSHENKENNSLNSAEDKLRALANDTPSSDTNKAISVKKAINAAYTTITQRLQSYSTDAPSDTYLDLACCLDYLEQIFKTTDIKPKDAHSLCQLSHLLFLDGDRVSAAAYLKEATAADKTAVEIFYTPSPL